MTHKFCHSIICTVSYNLSIYHVLSLVFNISKKNKKNLHINLLTDVSALYYKLDTLLIQ